MTTNEKKTVDWVHLNAQEHGNPMLLSALKAIHDDREAVSTAHLRDAHEPEEQTPAA